MALGSLVLYGLCSKKGVFFLYIISVFLLNLNLFSAERGQCLSLSFVFKNAMVSVWNSIFYNVIFIVMAHQIIFL